MANYTPTTWTDEVPAISPVKYKITDDSAGVIANSAKIEMVTSVTSGTPLNAANLNHMEAGIAAASVGGNMLIASKVATGTANEFDFNNIPSGYRKLRLVGALKQTFTNGIYPAANPTVRINADSGANYAYLNPSNGAWVGWGNNLSIYTGPIIGSWTADAGMINTFSLELPDYTSAVLKWALIRNISGNTEGNPTGGIVEVANLWRSTAVITRIQVLGTFVSSISHLELYGCAL